MPAAQAAQVVLKFAHEAPETAIKGQTANKFAELVDQYTSGAVKIQVYPGGQLVPTMDEIRAVARGQIDIAAPYTSYFSGIDRSWDVLYQPLLFKSPEHAINIFAGPIGKHLLASLSTRGITGLGIWHDGPVYLFAKGEPIREPGKLQGRKVRMAPSRPLEALLEAARATSVSIPATEVYLALQQGVADSVLTTPTYAGPAKWNEVLTSGSKMMFGVGGYGFVVNSKSLSRLSPEQKAGFLRAADEASAWNREQALSNIAHWEKYLADNGLQWFTPDAQELGRWQQVADAAEAAQSDDAKALIDQIRQQR
ncbi:TRAP transporter substrate-binding protein [Bordetella sp. BOR01]|uniref:TRAP transporter substrate-binding protein n=1 Tax=Bordetella sp. BOR01 TaxID=2854779 RepID=UPI001C48D315|nr:TRAP transporter substrate-binding protein DctP [Bordetella sp. BOR01]MBV7484619.1 TRAP transporter substrate-binding protein DctP [Bordetella sp. BOR01]